MKSKFNVLYEEITRTLCIEEEELHGKEVKKETFDKYEITIYETEEESYMYHITKDGKEIAREEGKFDTIEAAIQGAKEYIDEHKED
jgi:hypothetical protein